MADNKLDKHVENISPSKKKKPKKTATDGMVYESTPGSIAADVIIYLVLISAVFIALIPMWHTIMASFSNGQQLIAHEGIAWRWVGEFNWAGYQKTISYANHAILKSYGITVMYVVGNVVFGLVINVIGAYVIYRRPKFATLFSIMIILTILFKGGIIPKYMIVRKIGFINTAWALMLPTCTNAIFLFMQMTAFKQVPVETVEAAEIDGASHLDIMFRVLLPQARGLTIVILINTAILSWNRWFEASIYVTTERALWPLQLWIKQIVAENRNIINVSVPDWDKYLVQYAVILIATMPVLMIMPFIQKQIQKGALIGAVK